MISGPRRRLNATDTELFDGGGEVLEIRDDDPISAKIDTRNMQGFRRGDWDVRVETARRMTLTESEFLLTGEIKAFDLGKEVFSKVWDRKIARKFV